METKVILPGVRPKANTTGLVLSVGSGAAVVMMLYFLVMRAFGLHEVIELRYLNVIIMFVAVLITIKRHKTVQGRVKYLEGLRVGFLTSLAAAGLFMVFLIIYLINDPPFVHYLNQHAFLKDEMGPVALAGHAFLECLISGSIFGFICMQYFRTRA
jgi:hypothetical protein